MKKDNANFFLKPKSGLKIVRYVTGVHMALSHRGLKLMAKKLGLNADTMDSGEFIIFMNSGQTAFKLLTANNIICYYRHPKEHRIDPRVISLIPKVFDGKEIKLDAALESIIKQEFK